MPSARLYLSFADQMPSDLPNDRRSLLPLLWWVLCSRLFDYHLTIEPPLSPLRNRDRVRVPLPSARLVCVRWLRRHSLLLAAEQHDCPAEHRDSEGRDGCAGQANGRSERAHQRGE